MPRTTRTQLEGTLHRLAQMMGLPLADSGRAPGLMMDFSAPYGGWKVVMRNADTSESDIFGTSRCSASEMWERLAFAIQVLEQSKRVTRPAAPFIGEVAPDAS